MEYLKTPQCIQNTAPHQAPEPAAPRTSRDTPTRHLEPINDNVNTITHKGSVGRYHLNRNLLAPRQATLADLILQTLDINKGTNTPKVPAHLQSLDASTQLYGELLLSTPKLLEIRQALGKVPVLLEHFFHLSLGARGDVLTQYIVSIS